MNQKGFANITLIVLVIAILAVAGFVVFYRENTPYQKIPELVGKWAVVSVEENGAQIVSEGSSAIIEFFNNGTYKAFGGCNEMSISSYTTSDSRISFIVGGTKRGCPENIVEFWDLGRVNSYELNGDILLLHYKGEKDTGTFELRKEKEQSVSWQKAVELIRTCQVKMVYQSHSLNVNLRLADGSKVATQEPRIDQVIDEIRKVSDKCGAIPIATE